MKNILLILLVLMSKTVCFAQGPKPKPDVFTIEKVIISTDSTTLTNEVTHTAYFVWPGEIVSYSFTRINYTPSQGSSGSIGNTASVPDFPFLILPIGDTLVCATITITGSITGNTVSVSSCKQQPLPVELLSFVVKNENDFAHVTWQTRTETNSSHFEILRSQNGFSYEQIGTVFSVGNSSTQIDYSLWDRVPLPDKSFYKLVQYDLDGKSREYDPVVFKSKNSPKPFIAYDMTGRIVFQGLNFNQLDFEREAPLPKGLYVIAFPEDNDLRSSRKAYRY